MRLGWPASMLGAMKRTLPIFAIAAVLVAGCGSDQKDTQKPAKTQTQVAQTAPAATTTDSTTGPDLIACAKKKGLQAENYDKRSIAVASIKPDIPGAKVADVRMQSDAAPGREIHAYVITNGDLDKIKVALDGFSTTERYGNVLVDYSNSKAEFSPKAEACLPS
jgi:hypothetical protein